MDSENLVGMAILVLYFAIIIVGQHKTSFTHKQLELAAIACSIVIFTGFLLVR